MGKVWSRGAIFALLLAAPAAAQAPAQPRTPPPPPPALGPSITLEQAKPIIAAAEAEARRQGAPSAIVVVEPSGDMVMFEKMAGTQYGAVPAAEAKAKSAAWYRRSTKAFADGLTNGNLLFQNLPGGVPIEGGVPIVIDGRMVGAIGSSGGSLQQDGAVANAGAAAAR